MVKVRGTLGTLEVCPTVLMEYELMSVCLSVCPLHTNTGVQIICLPCLSSV